MSVKVMSDKKVPPATEKLVDRGIVNFVGEIKSEFSKVTWTSQDELKTYTQIVVGATFLFGLGVYVVDVVIQAGLNTLDLALRFVAG